MRYFDENTGFYFDVKEDHAVISDASKDVINAAIPETYNSLPVTGIVKKAFLGCKQLKTLTIPENIKTIGDWGFAGCDQLKDVFMKPRQILFGKGVFERDKKLRRIQIEGKSEKTSYLLAAAVKVMEADYFLENEEVGSIQWYKKWDQKLENILNLKDDEGYHLYVLCGEEDLHFDYEQYLEYNKKKKAGLAQLRLICNEYLSDDLSERLKSYILEHIIGCESRAAWDHVMDEHGDDLRYYELLVTLGAIDRSNLETALELMGDRHAQARAFLLNYFNQDNESLNYFDDLLL